MCHFICMNCNSKDIHCLLFCSRVTWNLNSQNTFQQKYVCILINNETAPGTCTKFHQFLCKLLKYISNTWSIFNVHNWRKLLQLFIRYQTCFFGDTSHTQTNQVCILSIRLSCWLRWNLQVTLKKWCTLSSGWHCASSDLGCLHRTIFHPQEMSSIKMAHQLNHAGQNIC